MSLRLKMILGIGAILILITAEYAFVARKAQSDLQWAVATREAELIASVADRAVSIAMENGKSDDVQALFERMASSPVSTELRIVDLEGKVLRSSLPGEIGRTLAPHERPTISHASVPIQDPAARTAGIFLPIRNAPSCSRCHPVGQPILGLLSVRLPLSTSEPRSSDQLRFIVTSGMAGLAAAGVLITLLFTFLVGRRIDALSVSMRVVQAGDLTVRVPDASPDELGRLTRGFNMMVARLAEEKQRREDQHAEQIRRAEQVAALGKMAAVGRITSGIAHEINNPLNNISLTAEVLLEDLPNMACSERLDMVRDILVQSDRAREVVHHLLEFSRTSKSNTMEPVDLVALVESSITLVKNQFRLGGIVYHYDHPEQAVLVNGNPNHLQQVLVNLMLNAVQAMPPEGRLDLTVQLAGKEAIIMVRDTGAGMAPETQAHIFDPFFTTKNEGTGLGLSLSYAIVKDHRGEIEVESEQGKGTTFRIRLPRLGADV